jgi:hypothetical protein
VSATRLKPSRGFPIGNPLVAFTRADEEENMSDVTESTETTEDTKPCTACGRPKPAWESTPMHLECWLTGAVPMTGRPIR